MNVMAKKKACSKSDCKKSCSKKSCGTKKQAQKKCGETLPETQNKPQSKADYFLGLIKKAFGYE